MKDRSTNAPTKNARSTNDRTTNARTTNARSTNLQTRNTLCSVLRHLTAIACGLVLPREILSHYGSDLNGVWHAVSQFLSYTVLLELGIGAVIPAALYRPLATRDWDQVSGILSSGYRVLRRIAGICLVYTLLLLALFPALTGVPASAWFILILGCTRVLHYWIGIPEQLLIISDQRGYLIYSLSAVTTVFSTWLQVLLIRAGHPLVTVKLAAAVLNALQLLVICLFARRRYPIHPERTYTGEPIPQKWNGIAQHVAYFVLENTDIVLLTLFAGFREVSVYSVYFMVISGIRQIFFSVSYSVQPKLGELVAKGNREELNRFFATFERWIHVSTILVFCCLGLFLVPFVQVYTEGVTDANYIRPLFAALMTLAYGFQSIRDPYDKLILASGHFRQTQLNYVIAAALNLGISLAAVPFFGMEGVAAGTLAAMGYQMIYMSLYDTRNILKRSHWVLVRNFLRDAVMVLGILLAARMVQLPAAEIIRQVLGLVRFLF